MNTYDSLISRRTIHDYTSQPIDESALTRALNAALRAPNHKLTNPWRFTRVGPIMRPRIVELGVRLKTAGKDASPQAESKIRTKLSSAPILMVVSQVINPDPVRYKEDYAAIACAIENFSLSLWSEGIGSKWSSGKVTTHPETYELLNIPSDTEEIIGFVWVGYPAVIPDTPRLPLEQVYRITD